MTTQTAGFLFLENKERSYSVLECGEINVNERQESVTDRCTGNVSRSVREVVRNGSSLAAAAMSFRNKQGIGEEAPCISERSYNTKQGKYTDKSNNSTEIIG